MLAKNRITTNADHNFCVYAIPRFARNDTLGVYPVILNGAKRSELAVCRGRQLVADHAQMHATGERVQANSRRLKNHITNQSVFFPLLNKILIYFIIYCNIMESYSYLK